MRAYLYSLIILIGVNFLASCTVDREVNIIPEPMLIEHSTGEFLITHSTQIFSDEEFERSEKVVTYFSDIIFQSSGVQLKLADTKPDQNFIYLKSAKEITNEEGYQLISTSNGITISASESVGLFYGIQTLLQLLPPEVFSNNKSDYKLVVPNLTIKDEPRFSWRGVHLDVGRHMYNVVDIKKYIDYLAFHKIRQFHWHLTEDQGWRIEVKKYPKLTSIGAWRKETMGDGTRYGGFYTQDEVKEIVSYADSRFIQVIPEIELPGHSVAALAAYPEFSCTGGPFEVATTWGVHSDVYCAGNEQTFKFLEDVFEEIIPLFPSKYIHIGGDECPKIRWEKCEKCQRRIKEEGLKDEHELQSYFIQRMEKYLATKNRQIIGWDEILEGGLAPQATVMSWRGIEGGVEAAKQGHDVIMTPGSHCYFNHHQGDPAFEPNAFGSRLTLSTVYSFEPIPEELNSDEAKYILGAQANMWTEHLPTFNDIEYMLMPRLAALSEVVWSPRNKKNIDNFIVRMETQLQRYDQLGVNYAKSAYNAVISTKFNDKTNTLDASISSELGNSDIYFTTDGSLPDNNSARYTAPIKINESTVIKAVSYKGNKPMSNVTSKEITIHKAFGKKIEIANSYADKYESGGHYSVVDGLFGTNSFQDSYWQGYEEVDFDATINLGSLTKINSIESGFIQDNHSWIFLPEYVEYSFSSDGKNFSDPVRIINDIDPKYGEVIVKRFSAELNNQEASFIRVIGKNIGHCPEWHQGAGGKAWLFIDEIKVN